MSTDLATWLLDRIAEDEAVARAATPGHWSPQLSGVYWHDGDRWHTVIDGDTLTARENCAHIARWDPARVLAECEARRKIVELHVPDHECTDGSQCYPGVFSTAPGFPVCQTLRLLAMPYAGHPEFRSEWAL